MITINPELQSLIPPLTAEEYAQLEANILADGCHDPLIVWQEEQTLLDGHNRLRSASGMGSTMPPRSEPARPGRRQSVDDCEPVGAPEFDPGPDELFSRQAV